MRSFFLSILIFCVFTATAQTNYTGEYGYTESFQQLKKRHPGISDEESGYESRLIFLRLNKQQYRFWLYVIKGYPSYNSGQVEGTVKVEGNKGVFRYTDSISGSECVLKFWFTNTAVTVEEQQGDCGFGANVSAYGRHPKINSKIPSTATIAAMGQAEVQRYTISVDKAAIYPAANSSKSTGQYFIRGDEVYVFDETKDRIYFQHVTKKGRFVEGWLDNSSVRAAAKNN